MASAAAAPLTNGAGASAPPPPVVSDIPAAAEFGVPVRVTQPADWVPPAPRPVPGAGLPAYLQDPKMSASPSPTSPATPGQPGRPRNRPTIMDPPGTQINSSALQSSGFPSPIIDHAATNPKFLEDVARLTYAVHQSLGESVRRVIRDNWEKCLIGTDFHQAFVLNASIHHASPSMTRRSIRDFGQKMVTSSKKELIDHFSATDLDAVADIILRKASVSFLDKALEIRLQSIAANSLLNALARAERLGYVPDDIVEEDRSRHAGPGPGQSHGQERVIPSVGSVQPHAAPAASHAMPSTPSNIPPPNPFSSFQCQACFRTFVVESAFQHHTKKNVCTRTPATREGFQQGFQHSCAHCGQGFTTIVGLQYHLNNKVCGDFGETPADIKAAARGQPTQATPQGGAMPFSQPTSTPRPRPARTSSPPRLPVVAKPEEHMKASGDPYAHLNPTQRSALNEELHQAEIAFTGRFQAADALTDPVERRLKLEGLRNSFGTKQSNIRKKYGVKLRERRTKAEIDAERSRMGRGKNYTSPPPASSGPTATAIPPGTAGAYSTQQPAASTTPRPSTWTAANVPASNGPVKREVIELDDDDTDSSAPDPKRARVNGAGHESPLGGSGPDISNLARQAMVAAASSGPAMSPTQTPTSAQPSLSDEPMGDAGDQGEGEDEDDDTDDDENPGTPADDDDDDDIPATLPQQGVSASSRPGWSG